MAEVQTQGVKRTHEDSEDILKGVQTVILDIEGTTTPISFVKEKLFPYVKENVKSYLESHWDEEECKEDIEALRTLATEDKEGKIEGVVEIPAKDEDKKKQVEAIVASVEWLMEKDRKSTALKQLQGHMWREAYKTGAVQGEVYADVVPALKQWKADGKKVCVYSSGSVEAQKLLFGYSTKGDLTEYFSDYYDTTTGAKQEKESYVKIAEKTESKPEETLFYTDIVKEAAAAAEAGYKVCLVEREGNTPLSEEEKKTYNTVSTLAAKDKKEDSDEPPAKQPVSEEKSPEKKDK